MKKILFFISSLEDGGAQRVVSIIASKLAQRGYEISVLKYYAGDNLFPLSKDVKVESCQENTGSTSIIKNICYMHNKFKEYDVILSFLAPFNMMAIVANLFNKTKLVVADRNDPSRLPSNKFVRLLRDILYCYVDKVVVQTTKNRAYFSKIVQGKTEVIYNPLILWGLDGKALDSKKNKTIINVARLEPQKNQDMLIDAFKEFHNSHSEYKLVIYGEGSCRKKLEKKAEVLGLADSISMPGIVEDIFDRLCECEFFVLSSNYEGMPNALIEAMGLGIPVISTRVSGATDLIDDKINGLLIDIDDRKALQEAMENLADNKETRIKMAKDAVKICDLLDCDNICSQWERIINDVL